LRLVAEIRPGPYTITASITAYTDSSLPLLVPLPDEDAPLDAAGYSENDAILGIISSEKLV